MGLLTVPIAPAGCCGMAWLVSLLDASCFQRFTDGGNAAFQDPTSDPF